MSEHRERLAKVTEARDTLEAQRQADYDETKAGEDATRAANAVVLRQIATGSDGRTVEDLKALIRDAEEDPPGDKPVWLDLPAPKHDDDPLAPARARRARREGIAKAGRQLRNVEARRAAEGATLADHGLDPGPRIYDGWLAHNLRRSAGRW
jgi:hypothetical protein